MSFAVETEIEFAARSAVGVSPFEAERYGVDFIRRRVVCKYNVFCVRRV